MGCYSRQEVKEGTLVTFPDLLDLLEWSSISQPYWKQLRLPPVPEGCSLYLHVGSATPPPAPTAPGRQPLANDMLEPKDNHSSFPASLGGLTSKGFVSPRSLWEWTPVVLSVSCSRQCSVWLPHWLTSPPSNSTSCYLHFKHTAYTHILSGRNPA